MMDATLKPFSPFTGSHNTTLGGPTPAPDLTKSALLRLGRPRRLHQFFERSCDRAPHASALVCGEEQWTYAILDARANQLAHDLINRHGVQPGDRVGLLLDRSVHTYVALLAVLKSGAAFVPVDPSYPADRIAFIAEDAAPTLLLTTSKFQRTLGEVSCPVLVLDREAETIARQPITRPRIDDDGDCLAYIIYTSGTTGRPKGVAVNQSNICNFISVCTPIYGVTARDRVYQGMITAFDFSIEEIWPTFAVGATLVAGPTDHRRLGSGLADFLDEQEISILYCVPTLLATVDRDIPLLRTLLVGGEACPADLVKRWSKAGRRILNTYGPTETTVTATWCELYPNRPVTIGKPLPTYTVHVLDENLRQVAADEYGEICIGGLGVARGYVNRPDLTAAKFVADPFSDRPGARLYRSGDLGRFTKDGEVEFAGRIDSQVKIRGYRIELAEIEAVMLEHAAVKDAIVNVAAGEGGVQDLAAYITLRGCVVDLRELKNQLHTAMRSRLPIYMVPAFIEIIDAIPMSPSGKADRRALPAPRSPRLGSGSGNHVAPATQLEKELAAAWGEVFGRKDLSVEENFFTDLGGHSLFAAQVISNLRQNEALRALPISALYANPTIRGLAKHIESLAKPADRSANATKKPAPVERLRHSSTRVWMCGLAQFGLVYLIGIVLGMPFAHLLGLGWHPLLALPIAGLLWMPVLLVLPFAAKWLLIGRYRPGRYPLWGWYYLRWWLAHKLMALSPLPYLAGSPFFGIYLRLLGARVGKGCHLGSSRLQLADLLDIGDGVSIGYAADLEPYMVKDGYLYMAPIRIGKDAYIGTNAVVMLGGVVGDGARILEQSLVAQDQVIPANETWSGSPSQRVMTDPALDEMTGRQVPKRWSMGLLAGFVAAFAFLELLPLLMVAPALLFLAVVSGGDMVRVALAAPAAGVIFVLSACGVLALAKRVILPKTPTGVFPLRSWFGLRKWLADNLMNTSLAVTNSLYATLYTVPWLRLLGAKIGKRAEVSTVSHIDPDLLVLGAESFVADLAVLGAARHYRGSIALGVTEIGVRTFVGNAALVPSNTKLADNSLIGVQSVPPLEPIKPGTSWLGSPAMYLPRRQSCGRFDESVTYRPTAKMVACRLAIEFLRITMPAVLLSTFGLLATLVAFALIGTMPALALVVVLPAIYLTAGLGVFLTVAGLKWLVMGRYRPHVAPMWSHFVWRSEFITALYESAAVPGLLGACTGTPFMAPLLRLLGARVGRRVYMETTYLTEFDLVRVGDDATIGGTTSLQTHLFEDRVMKMSTVTIGDGCTVGPRAVVLYDSELGNGAELDALSLAMKSERLPAETHWRGIPARLVD
jgi:non-ribosomal peptide synthetase-like protein